MDDLPLIIDYTLLIYDIGMTNPTLRHTGRRYELFLVLGTEEDHLKIMGEKFSESNEHCLLVGTKFIHAKDPLTIEDLVSDLCEKYAPSKKPIVDLISGQITYSGLNRENAREMLDIEEFQLE